MRTRPHVFPPRGTLTELDHVRLTRLLQRQLTRTRVIGELLDLAQVVPSRARSAPDVVTMYRWVLLHDAADARPARSLPGTTRRCRAGSGLVRSLAGGQTLLGLQAGELDGPRRWPHVSPRIEALLFQPGRAATTRCEPEAVEGRLPSTRRISRAVGFQFLRADAADAGQRSQRVRLAARHLGQRGVVEDDVGRQVVLARHLGAPGLNAA